MKMLWSIRLRWTVKLISWIDMKKQILREATKKFSLREGGAVKAGPLRKMNFFWISLKSSDDKLEREGGLGLGLCGQTT